LHLCFKAYRSLKLADHFGNNLNAHFKLENSNLKRPTISEQTFEMGQNSFVTFEIGKTKEEIFESVG